MGPVRNAMQRMGNALGFGTMSRQFSASNRLQRAQGSDGPLGRYAFGPPGNTLRPSVHADIQTHQLLGPSAGMHLWPAWKPLYDPTSRHLNPSSPDLQVRLLARLDPHSHCASSTDPHASFMRLFRAGSDTEATAHGPGGPLTDSRHGVPSSAGGGGTGRVLRKPSLREPVYREVGGQGLTRRPSQQVHVAAPGAGAGAGEGGGKGTIAAIAAAGAEAGASETDEGPSAPVHPHAVSPPIISTTAPALAGAGAGAGAVAGPPPTGGSAVRLSPFGSAFRLGFGMVRMDSSESTPSAMSPRCALCLPAWK